MAGLSPVTARAVGVKDQAGLTGLLVGVPVQAAAGGSLAGGAGVETPGLPRAESAITSTTTLGATEATGAEAVPRVGVGPLQPEERKEAVLEGTPVPGRLWCPEGHWGVLSAEGTLHPN